MPASVEKLLNSQYVQLALAALAFLIALWFVVVIARMLMGGRLRLPGGRTRQARLGIVDAFDLDRQRQLIIVRRDNTEHLIMIGGPNDLLIESEIVRVEGREAREARDVRRDKAGDGEPRVEGRAAPRLEAPLNGQRPDETAGQPMLPPFAAAPEFEDEVEGQRGPTFPLPPRRPTAPTATTASPQPERRTPPERATRPIEPAMFGAPQQPASPPTEPQPAPQPIPAQPMMPVEAFQPLPPAEEQPPLGMPPSAPPLAPATPAASPAPARPAPPVLGPADRPVPARPSPFLKPLPPRPPIRPLKRVTPQAVPPAQTPAAPEAAAPERPREPAAEAPHSAAEPVRMEPVEAPKDGIESLEEEMAKLLGR